MFIFDTQKISSVVKKDRYAFIESKDISINALMIKAWEELKESWNNLDLDMYMKFGDTYRKRKFAKFNVDMSNRSICIKDDLTFYQETELNDYAGGVYRKFPEMDSVVKTNPILQILFCTL